MKHLASILLIGFLVVCSGGVALAEEVVVDGTVKSVDAQGVTV